MSRLSCLHHDQVEQGTIKLYRLLLGHGQVVSHNLYLKYDYV